ncbi:hypothetical protein ACIBG8_21580 [Nonomuraea sp. NPDC050556]|uniref:hypothetical protein n=1 Tax=Nonomuraea sp. NPDC050556 TaxID=3364369 RepID=UPI0037A140F8
MACVALGAAGCSTSEWQQVKKVTLSPDGRLLTATVMFTRPASNPEQCERVADTSVKESSTQVVVGVLVEQDVCDRPWPWEEPTYEMLTGYPHPIPLRLKAPLGERVVVDSVTRKPLAVER